MNPFHFSPALRRLGATLLLTAPVLLGAAALPFAWNADQTARQRLSSAAAEGRRLRHDLAALETLAPDLPQRIRLHESLLARMGAPIPQDARLAALRQAGTRHGIRGLRYEPIPPRSVSAPGFAVRVDGVALRFQALHEVRLLDFLAGLDAIPALTRLRHCDLRRRTPAPEEPAAVDADCRLDWITLEPAS